MAITPSNAILPNDAKPIVPLVMVAFHNVNKLTSTNYLTWKLQIKVVLVGYGLLKFINGSHASPEPTTKTGTSSTSTPNPAYTTWARQDRLVFGALIGTLSTPIAALLTTKTMTKEVWDFLAQTYTRPSH